MALCSRKAITRLLLYLQYKKCDTIRNVKTLQLNLPWHLKCKVSLLMYNRTRHSKIMC